MKRELPLFIVFFPPKVVIWTSDRKGGNKQTENGMEKGAFLGKMQEGLHHSIIRCYRHSFMASGTRLALRALSSCVPESQQGLPVPHLAAVRGKSSSPLPEQHSEYSSVGFSRLGRGQGWGRNPVLCGSASRTRGMY